MDDLVLVGYNYKWKLYSSEKDRLDNRLSNLEYMIAQENIRRKFKVFSNGRFQGLSDRTRARGSHMEETCLRLFRWAWSLNVRGLWQRRHEKYCESSWKGIAAATHGIWFQVIGVFGIHSSPIHLLLRITNHLNIGESPSRRSKWTFQKAMIEAYKRGEDHRHGGHIGCSIEGLCYSSNSEMTPLSTFLPTSGINQESTCLKPSTPNSHHMSNWKVKAFPSPFCFMYLQPDKSCISQQCFIFNLFYLSHIFLSHVLSSSWWIFLLLWKLRLFQWNNKHGAWSSLLMAHGIGSEEDYAGRTLLCRIYLNADRHLTHFVLVNTTWVPPWCVFHLLYEYPS